MTTTLDIKIQGREYRVTCAPQEAESLQAAAELLDVRMKEAAQATKGTGERQAVMVALNLAHELNLARRNTRSPDAAPSENSIDEADALRRIKAIEAQLDEALAPQDSRF